MHVQTFVGESLDLVLQEVKRKLGPEAIIIKTQTRKGASGLLKKGKVEVTAAVAEKDYIKKEYVDRSMPEAEKKRFYQQPSSVVAETIQDYGTKKMNQGYGKIGVNRSVQTNEQQRETTPRNNVEKENPKNHALDQFLETPKNVVIEEEVNQEIQYARDEENENLHREYVSEIKRMQREVHVLREAFQEFSSQNESQKRDELKSLARYLQSSGLNHQLVHKILRKASFQLTDEEIDDEQTLMDWAIQDLSHLIKTKYPQFSSVEGRTGGQIVFLFGAPGSGVSSLAFKMAKLDKKSIIISTDKFAGKGLEAMAKGLGQEHTSTATFSELMLELRKNYEKDQLIIVDYHEFERDDFKKNFDIIKKSFSQIECYHVCSMLHEEGIIENFSKKMAPHADGTCINHLDLGQHFAKIFNLQADSESTPLVFFGIGDKIPVDIEPAMVERVMGLTFKFN
jgi:flagellar biosynthesis protein FlhF